MPVVILPVPSQFAHDRAPIRPVPLHTGHTFSPVLGAPAGASSPGFNGVAPVDGGTFGRLCDVFAMWLPLCISNIGGHDSTAFAIRAGRSGDDAAATASAANVFTGTRRSRRNFVAGLDRFNRVDHLYVGSTARAIPTIHRYSMHKRFGHRAADMPLRRFCRRKLPATPI